jgi:hypothetical protein
MEESDDRCGCSASIKGRAEAETPFSMPSNDALAVAKSDD